MIAMYWTDVFLAGLYIITLYLVVALLVLNLRGKG